MMKGVSLLYNNAFLLFIVLLYIYHLQSAIQQLKENRLCWLSKGNRETKTAGRDKYVKYTYVITI